MNWEAIKNQSQYKEAVKRTMEIFHAEEGTVEVAELDLLLRLVKDYEDSSIVLPVTLV